MGKPILDLEYLELSEELVGVVDAENSFQIVSTKWKKLLETHFQDGLVRSVFEIVHETDQTLFESMLANARTNDSLSTFECRLQLGSESRDFRWKIARSSRTGDTVLVGNEISTEKRTTRFLGQIEKSCRVGAWELNPDTGEMCWSSECFAMLEQNPNLYAPSLEDYIGSHVGGGAADIRTAFRSLDRSNEPFDIRLPLKTASGRTVWLRTIGRVHFVDRNSRRLIGTMQDITDRIEIDRETNRYAERFEVIANNIPVMLSLYDENGDFAWCNPHWVNELGWNKDSMKGRDMLAEFYPHPDERQKVLEFMLKPNAGWRDFNTRTRDGREIRTSWANARLSDGYTVGIGRNIDAEYRLSQDLRDTHDKLRLAMQTGGLGTFEYFSKSNKILVSQEWLKMLGYENQDSLGTLEDWISLVHPEDQSMARKHVFEGLRSAANQNSECVCRIKHKNGQWIYVRSIGQAVERGVIGAPDRFLAVTIDVTEAKTGEANLVEQKRILENMRERVQLALSAGKFGIWDWNVKRQELVWDQVMYDLFDVDPMEFRNSYPDFQRYLLPEDAARIQTQLNETFENQMSEFRAEFRIRTSSGTEKIISALASCFYDDDGKIDRLVGCNWDITEQKMSQAALMEARQEAERFFTLSLDPVCVVDASGHFKRINPAFIETLGYSIEELNSINILDIVHPEDRSASREHLRHLRKFDRISHFEHRVRGKDGRYRILDWVAKADLEAQLVYGAFRDVTEAREKEIKLLQSARMATLGEMAGGIAHEINNPLAIINGRASQIMRALDRGVVNLEKLKYDLSRIAETSERIAKIVRGLRTFSRDSQSDPMIRENLRSIVIQMLDLARERLKNHEVELQVHIQGDAYVMCRPQQVGQVILNLVNNAHDAVVGLAEKWVRVEVTMGDGLARIVVIDSGKGIATAIADKMMNPFFTTKEVGKGTGLGLSISKGIAEDHGGQLVYAPTSESNTAFQFELPLAVPNKDETIAS